MPKCKVSDCPVGNKNYQGPKYMLFTFPKGEEDQKVWLGCLNRPGLVVTKNTRICERHFTAEDFVPDEENYDSFNRKRKRKHLKPEAFPTLYLPEIVEESEFVEPDKYDELPDDEEEVEVEPEIQDPFHDCEAPAREEVKTVKTVKTYKAVLIKGKYSCGNCAKLKYHIAQMQKVHDADTTELKQMHTLVTDQLKEKIAKLESTIEILVRSERKSKQKW